MMGSWKWPAIALVAVLVLSGCSNVLTEDPGSAPSVNSQKAHDGSGPPDPAEKGPADEAGEGSDEKRPEAPGEGPPAAADTIVDIASSSEDLEILTQAVVFAGLADELSARRQFTVFAPTDAAFEALLAALGLTPAELLAEGNEELVRSILLYHVAPGQRFAEDVLEATRVNTLLKEFAFVKVDDEGAFIGNDTNGYAEITATDIDASNGVIHVIDAVLLQPSVSL